MKVDFRAVNNGAEVVYVNPLQVRYFSSNGSSEETRIVFDADHSLKVKASPMEVEKMLVTQGAQ
jgi:hypothetical protein